MAPLFVLDKDLDTTLAIFKLLLIVFNFDVKRNTKLTDQNNNTLEGMI